MKCLLAVNIALAVPTFEQKINTTITWETVTNIVNPIVSDLPTEHGYFFKFTGNGNARYQDANGVSNIRSIYSKTDKFIDSFRVQDSFNGFWRRWDSSGVQTSQHGLSPNYDRNTIAVDPMDIMHMVGKYKSTNRLTLESLNTFDETGGTFVGDTSLDYGSLVETDRFGSLYVLGKKGVTIRLLKYRQRPTAKDDSFEIPKNGQFQSTYSVVRNDYGVYNGTTIGKVTMSSQPQHGVANLSSTGHVQYVPDANYFGQDSFDYQDHKQRLQRYWSCLLKRKSRTLFVDCSKPSSWWKLFTN